LPALVAGVDRRFVENGTFTDNETVVAMQHDPALMNDEILRLVPCRSSIAESGSDAQRTVPDAGVGLVAMRERLKLVNGDSLIISRRGEGTRVEAWVPSPLQA
jgi:hypothetical protein